MIGVITFYCVFEKNRRITGIATKNQADLAGFKTNKLVEIRRRYRRDMRQDIAVRALHSEVLLTRVLQRSILVDLNAHISVPRRFLSVAIGL